MSLSSRHSSDDFSDEIVEGLILEVRTSEAIDVSDEVDERLSRIPEDYSGESALARQETMPQTIGSYKIIEELRAGGMGCVYRAHHTILDRDVALKVMLPRNVQSKHGLERFRREMRSLAAMNHPNVVKAFDGGTDQETAFLAMELLKGKDLQQLATEEQLTVMRCCELIRQAAIGLAAVHAEGVIHRDVKPANIMLTESGNVKLIDFGLALSIDEGSDLTDAHQIVGSGKYIAPEQRQIGNPADHRSDIYSLGMTLQTLLLQSAFGTATLPESRIPVPLRQLLADMLAESPPIRIQSASEVADRLADFCQKYANTITVVGGDPVEESASGVAVAAPPGVQAPEANVEKNGRSRQTRTVLTICVAVGVLTMVVLAALFPRQWPGSDAKKLPNEVITARGAGIETATPVGTAAVTHVNQEDQIAQFLIAHGAMVTVNILGADGWTGVTTNREEDIRGKLCQIHVVQMQDVSDPEDCLSEVLKLRYLQGFHSNTSHVSDEYLAKLPESWELKWLYIPSSSVSDNGVRNLEKYQSTLENLDLSLSLISGSGVRRLGRFPSLRELRVVDTELGDNDFSALPQFPSLVALDLSGTAVTDSVTEHISGCRKIGKLKLRDTMITDAGVERCEQLPLRELDLSTTQVTEMTVNELRQRHPEWTITY